MIGADELGPEYVIPSVFNRDVALAVAAAVAEAAEADGVARRSRPDLAAAVRCRNALLLVRNGFERIQLRRPARGHDRRQDPDHHGDDREHDELDPRDREAHVVLESARLTRAARKIPSGSPIAAPMSAVMMLSWRIIRRTCRRVIPIARSIPISRVRSYTDRTRVLIIPKMLTNTARVSMT